MMVRRSSEAITVNCQNYYMQVRQIQCSRFKNIQQSLNRKASAKNVLNHDILSIGEYIELIQFYSLMSSEQENSNLSYKEAEVQQVKSLNKKEKQVEFSFPVKLVTKESFKNQQSVNIHLESEAKDMEMQYRCIWKWVEISKDKKRLLCLKCKQKAFIDFMVQQDRLRILQYVTAHKHIFIPKLDKRQDALQYISLYYDQMKDPEFKKQVMKKFDIQSRHIAYILSKIEGMQPTNSKDLSEFLKQNGFIYEVAWGKDAGENANPEYIVITNQNMKNFGEKFGDVLELNMIRNIKHNQDFQFSIALVICEDTNRRQILIGLIIFLNQDGYNMAKALNCLMKLTKCNPKCLVTDFQPVFADAYSRLKTSKKIDSHLYHIKPIRQKFLKIFKQQYPEFPIKEKELCIRLFNEIIVERDYSEGRKKLEQLGAMINDYSKFQNIIQEFGEHIKSYCLWFSRDTNYIGLTHFKGHLRQRINAMYHVVGTAEKIKKAIVQKLKSDLNLINFVRVITDYGAQKIKTALSRCDTVADELQFVYQDPKLKALRACVQFQVYIIFFESYIQARENCTLHLNVNSYTYEIMNVSTKTVWKITSWKCECGFTLKTGIPCAHTVFLAMKVLEAKKYYELFNTRWIAKNAHFDGNNKDGNVEVRLDRKPRSRGPNIVQKYDRGD